MPQPREVAAQAAKPTRQYRKIEYGCVQSCFGRNQLHFDRRLQHGQEQQFRTVGSDQLNVHMVSTGESLLRVPGRRLHDFASILRS